MKEQKELIETLLSFISNWKLILLHGMVDICLVFKFTTNGKVFKCC